MNPLPRSDWDRVLAAAARTLKGKRRPEPAARLRQALLTVLLYQGAHGIELCRLTRDDVCLDKPGSITFRRRGNTRVMELHPRTRQALRSYLVVRPAPAPAYADQNPLWVTTWGTPVTSWFVIHLLREVARRARLGRSLTAGDLRESFGVYLYQVTRSRKLTQEHLGLRDAWDVRRYLVD